MWAVVDLFRFEGRCDLLKGRSGPPRRCLGQRAKLYSTASEPIFLVLRKTMP